MLKDDTSVAKNVKHEMPKRSSDMLRTLKTKSIKGLGSSTSEPMVINVDEDGSLTQEHTEVVAEHKLGTYMSKDS